MKSVFLSHSFTQEDRELVGEIEQLLASHGLVMTRGKRLGGVSLITGIEAKIQEADALIALMTRRGQPDPADGFWRTHDWVRDEFGMVRRGQPRIALIESGVRVGGQLSELEHLPFDRADRLAAMLALAETIGIWRQEAGRVVKVQILPEELAQAVGQGDGSLRCFYRTFTVKPPEMWVETTPIFEPGGTFVYVDRVGENHLIQIRVAGNNSRWLSRARSQFLEVRLEKQQ
ncbi:MAG TPA: hypothetical protein VIO38_16960 [Rariglobus sp.]